MKQVNFKILNIILFCLYTILFVFEITKVCIWVSHRPINNNDISEIGGAIECFLVFILWFIFSMLYECKGKFRKTSFAFFIVFSIFCFCIIYSKATRLPYLYFGNENYTPPFIDKFTSMFELCFICVFTLLFVSYFIFLLCKKHFKKSINLPTK